MLKSPLASLVTFRLPSGFPLSAGRVCSLGGGSCWRISVIHELFILVYLFVIVNIHLFFYGVIAISLVTVTTICVIIIIIVICVVTRVRVIVQALSVRVLSFSLA